MAKASSEMIPKARALLLLLLGASYAVASNSTNATSAFISTSQHDVILLVGQNATLVFNVERNASSSFQSSFRLEFNVENPLVLTVDPPYVNVNLEPGVARTNFSVVVVAVDAGITTITSNASDPDANVVQAFSRVTVSKSEALDVLSTVVGWIYFVAWSISFYPQIYENWKRRSVIGLNFDFLGLNLIGFTLYGLFNIGLYWIEPIQAEYFRRHPTGVNPVALNDVIFAIHAAFACVVTIAQCIVYERGHQNVSRVCKLIMAGIALFLAVSLIVSLAGVLKWLDFLYFCSYVKLFITLIKYIPQAYMNFRRKSTMGWSIGNVMLDFTGGILSIGQMFIQSYNNNYWGTIFGDPTKFGLGLFSVVFDIFFVVQHYVLYRNNHPSEPLFSNLEEQNEDDDRSGSDAEQMN